MTGVNEIAHLFTTSEITGMTFTSQGHLAVIKDVPAVYTTSFTHMNDLIIPNSESLYDVTRRENLLFISQNSATTCIHVISETGLYSHEISVSFCPYGLHMHGSHLYVTDYTESKLYKLTLDTKNNVVHSEVLLSGLKKPVYLYVTDDRIMMATQFFDKLKVYTTNGDDVWTYGGSGVMDMPYGIALDSWGRVLVADHNNHRVALISSDGQFITDLVSGMAGQPVAVVQKGRNFYISQKAPNGLLAFEIS